MSEPNSPPASELTRILRRAQAGSETDEALLFDRLQRELHAMASSQMRGQGAHTLQPTALVHEAWLRLFEVEAGYQDRDHFLAVAARAMRSVLVDHARRRNRKKRGGDRDRLPLELALDMYEDHSTDLVELDDAIDRLASDEARQAKVIELRFFGGLTIEETARVLSISPATVERDWKMARLWLLHELGAA